MTRQNKWELGAKSETGYVRKANEDRMSSIPIGNFRLYLVVDGMGGHNAGARAAELTIQSLQECMSKFLPTYTPPEAIAAAFAATNQIVYAQAHSDDASIRGMGATAVMLLTLGPLAYIAHVGDSRAYLFAKGRLERLTKDHSAMERMIAAGILTPAEAHNHPQASMIDRAVGDKHDLEVEIAKPFNLEVGDGVLLCSDGLCGYVDDAVIEAVLKCSPKAQLAVDSLVQEALNAGGEDNVTVQFIRLNHPYGGQKKLTGIGPWLKNLLQFKIRTGFLIALLMASLLALALKLMPLPLEFPEINQPPLNSPNKGVQHVEDPVTQALPIFSASMDKRIEAVVYKLGEQQKQIDTMQRKINEIEIPNLKKIKERHTSKRKVVKPSTPTQNDKSKEKEKLTHPSKSGR
jgi:serine/threonine protein phosphatase PrpC